MVVSFHALAERELNDGAQYYEQQQTGLGDAFLTEVRRCTREIKEHPHARPVVLGEVHRRVCHRFPYALLYTIRPGTIRILAVMNLRRRPAYWVGRYWRAAQQAATPDGWLNCVPAAGERWR